MNRNYYVRKVAGRKRRAVCAEGVRRAAMASRNGGGGGSEAGGSGSAELVVGKMYKMGKRFGAGNFGELRIGRNMKTGETVAIKVEPLKTSSPCLHLENKFYRMLGTNKGIEGVPDIFYYGPCGSRYNTLVMEMLGPSLEDMFDLCNRRFSVKTVCYLARQLLFRFEHIHDQRIVYRDVKPENFLIGREKNGKHRVVFVVDFGLAKEYMDSHGEHIP